MSSNIWVTGCSRRRVMSHSSFSHSSAAYNSKDNEQTEEENSDDKSDDGGDCHSSVIVVIAISFKGWTVSPVIATIVEAIVVMTRH